MQTMTQPLLLFDAHLPASFKPVLLEVASQLRTLAASIP